MADHVDPTAFLEDLQHVFAEGVRSGQGANLDPELCKFLVEGLGEAANTVRALRTLAEQGGLLQRLTLPTPAPAPRSPAARRHLAATVKPLDQERRVVAFPAAFAPVVPFSSGGSAA